ADYFDDILVATSTGEVLFESNPSGPRIGNLEALISPPSAGAGKSDSDAKAKAGAFRDISQFSNVRDGRLAGGLYKPHVQPGPFQIFGDEQAQPASKTVICGLWRADRQQSDLVSIPYATLIWGGLGALAAFGLLWPILKVAYMSPTERL